MIVTSAMREGTATRIFSYNAPRVSMLTPSNAPTRAARLLTVYFGLNLGGNDHTVMASIGNTPSENTVWTSDSAVLVMAPAGHGEGVSMIVTSAMREGTATRIFSYNAPRVSMLTPSNAPPPAVHVITVPEGYGEVLKTTTLTILGSNFHVSNPSPRVRVGITLCSASKWLSDSSLLCALAPGFSYGSEGSKSGSQDVQVVLGGVNASTSITGAFTYDAPCGAGYTNVVYTISNVTAHGFACVRCAAGKYKSVEGNVQCTACPEAQRMISSQGSTSWLDCLCLPGNPGFLGPAGGPCFGACTHEAVRAAFLHEHSDREFTDNDLKRSCDWELTAFYRAHADKHSCRYLAGSKYLCAARQNK